MTSVPAGVSDEVDGASITEPTRLRKSDRTRERIVRSARVVFERSGHRDARVADIAAEAGVAHGTFYRYFESKDDVFRVLAERVRSELVQAQGRIPSPDEDGSEWVSPEVGVRAAMRRYLRVFRDNARFIELMEEALTYDQEVRRLRFSLRAHLSENTAAYINFLASKELVARGLDIPYTTELIGSMVDRFAYLWFALGADFDEERALEALTKGYLRLIGWRPLVLLDHGIPIDE